MRRELLLFIRLIMVLSSDRKLIMFNQMKWLTVSMNLELRGMNRNWLHSSTWIKMMYWTEWTLLWNFIRNMRRKNMNYVKMILFRWNGYKVYSTKSSLLCLTQFQISLNSLHKHSSYDTNREKLQRNWRNGWKRAKSLQYLWHLYLSCHIE